MRVIRRAQAPGVGLALAVVVSLVGVQPVAVAAAPPPHGVHVVVRADAGQLGRVAGLVRSLGGTVERRIALVHGLSASLPAGAVSALQRSPLVASVSPDAPVTLLNDVIDGHDFKDELGSPYSVRFSVGADRYWNRGFTGDGVGVALIDSGVAPVNGLRSAGKIINGPDLSFESQDADLRYLDTYGHGTHMAGIIAGRDAGGYDLEKSDKNHFLGIAPGAHIVSLKIADAFGGTDVSQVLAAIDWVVKHRDDPGLNIRVLNLSFGTDSVQPYVLDPLAYAVEVAWRKGIFVVVAAGNSGYGSAKLNAPAYDPYVMAVGAADNRGTYEPDDDVVASYSSSGDAKRFPDLVATGRSIVSLRSPGSYIDQHNPGARVGDTPRFLRGSGTSQAAAVVSGAAALVIQQRPHISPDQLKALLTSTAYKLPVADPRWQGAGMIDLERAIDARTPSSTQSWPRSTGKGSLDASRGSNHLVDAGVVLDGERDIFGRAFDSGLWATRSLALTAWDLGKWLDHPWSGPGWGASSWAGVAWKGRSWTTGSWSGRSWTSEAWSGRSWTASGWSGGTWSGRSWTSVTWSGNIWSGADWPGHD